MMRHRGWLILVLFSVLVMLLGAAAVGQRAEHAALEALAEGRGWYMGATGEDEPPPRSIAGPRTGWLDAQGSEVIELQVSGLSEALVIAACDADCGDLDLRLLDSDGQTLAVDEEPDSFPVLFIDSGDRRQLEVEVTMSACAASRCAYALEELQYDDQGVGGSGTCFAVSPDGLLMTAWHVVEGSTELVATFPSGFSRRATLVVGSPANDVALLRIPDWNGAWLPLAQPSEAATGQPVFTVGYPDPDLLNRDPKFTEGSVSALTGFEGEVATLQMQVPIQPGNSGGPLVSHEGLVIGIVQSIVQEGDDGTPMQLVNYAGKSEFAALLLPPHVRAMPRPVSRSRQQAIDRALAATCRLEVS